MQIATINSRYRFGGDVRKYIMQKLTIVGILYGTKKTDYCEDVVRSKKTVYCQSLYVFSCSWLAGFVYTPLVLIGVLGFSLFTLYDCGSLSFTWVWDYNPSKTVPSLFCHGTCLVTSRRKSAIANIISVVNVFN